MASSSCSTRSDQKKGNLNTEEGFSSCFQKTVCLQEWWLIKSDKEFEGKRLAVAGLTSRGRQQVRVFYSAPIAKIFDVFTLETADGICVMLLGILNHSRMKENGFFSEVCRKFLLGFPPYWEEYAKHHCGEESSEGPGLKNISHAKKSTFQTDSRASVEEASINTDSYVSNTNSDAEDIERPSVPQTHSKDKQKENCRNDAEDVIPHSANKACGTNSLNVSGTHDGQIHKSMCIAPTVLDFNSLETSGSTTHTSLAVPIVSSSRDTNYLTPNAVEIDAVNDTFTSKSNDKGRITRSKSFMSKQIQNPISLCSMKGKDSNLSRVDTLNHSDICVEVSHGTNTRSPAVCNPHFSKSPGNQIEISVEVPVVPTRIDPIGDTANAAEMAAVDVTCAGNYGVKRSSFSLKNSTNNLKEKTVSRSTKKSKNKMSSIDDVVLTEGKRAEGNKSSRSVSTPEATAVVSVKRVSRDLTGTLKRKEVQKSSAKKAKRKIVFDPHVSPLAQSQKVSVVSPESLSGKRSRSGRLLVPPLHFWRNQIPIYDVTTRLYKEFSPPEEERTQSKSSRTLRICKKIMSGRNHASTYRGMLSLAKIADTCPLAARMLKWNLEGEIRRAAERDGEVGSKKHASKCRQILRLAQRAGLFGTSSSDEHWKGNLEIVIRRAAEQADREA